jgi:hypothetical protein
VNQVMDIFCAKTEPALLYTDTLSYSFWSWQAVGANVINIYSIGNAYISVNLLVNHSIFFTGKLSSVNYGENFKFGKNGPWAQSYQPKYQKKLS